MTHKITMNNLVLTYKRANESKGAVCNRALTALVAFGLAYNAPLPDNGQYGAEDAARRFIGPLSTGLVSDVNELLTVDVDGIIRLTLDMYQVRYQNSYGGRLALETPSINQVLTVGIGEDIVETVALWAERFLQATGFYLEEGKAQD